MKGTIKHNQNTYTFNFNSSIDISIDIIREGVQAFGIPKLKIQPVEQAGWVGDVSKGSAVNFNNISFNPHAHTTHTECVGHISAKKESLNTELTDFFFTSKLITVAPKQKNKDCVITKKMISDLFVNNDKVDALIIRTLPNDKKKKYTNYANTNPPYFLKGAIDYIVNQGICHLLVDLPSLDKEKDGGRLIAHKSFWRFPENIRHGSTITELIYVSPMVEDGLYLLNLQFIPFENDASPSRPLLFKLHKIDE
tara:strand:- start:5040 stop:5795 length:756 start_codon:yes stop_codon:yes gene_type:complete